MTPDKLSIERIQELYAQYLEQHFRDDWNKNYYEVVNRFRELSDDEFRLPENQEQLWRARGIANAGPGEAVSTVGAYSDIEIADALLAELRNENRPSDTELRAEEIQEAYERILALVHSRHSTNRPMIKLARAFAALLPHDSTVCLNWKSHDQLTALLLGPSKRSIQEAAVFSRSRLRQALGEEANLEEDVRRSIFCWWLTKNAVATDGDMQDPPSPVGKGGADSDDKKLVLYPISKQRKGVQAVAGYVDTHRLVVIAAQGGATADDIVESLHSDLTTYNHKSCRQLMSYVRSLGFLEYKDGLWYPSSDGEELVQSDPPNILVERLLIRNYGLAQLLRHIEANELSKKELYEKLKEQYPTWTGDFMPSSLLAWAYSLGLVHRDDGNTMRLTDYGQFWEMKLPTELPSPKIEPKTDELERVERHARPEPAIDEILSAFGKDEQLKAFVFGESEIRSIHAAWHSQKDKRFVIISGLSGTGKTALLLHYSRIYCELLELDPMVHRQLVAVSPDWRDPSGLLGYLNELQLDATFQPEKALQLVLEASRNSHLPYFLILDEMNLARVERYFAPFLSSMESGEALTIHSNPDEVSGVPPSIEWPKNLFIGGTVNMDETTHAFSDKVLDRAFTMEFFDVDLERFFDKRGASDPALRDPDAEKLLLEINEALRPIRRHFGYRAADEVLRFVFKAAAESAESNTLRTDALDQAVLSKVLPRLRGEESESMTKALEAVRSQCKDRELKRCCNKLDQMQDQLRHTGVTGFWS